MRQNEAGGLMERTGETQHTGKPGRPAQLWQLTDAGKEHAQADPRDFKTMLTELQAHASPRPHAQRHEREAGHRCRDKGLAPAMSTAVTQKR